MVSLNLVRCPWVNLKNQTYVNYHDKEWGVPIHDDTKLFEMLILETSQSGLSWEIILKKRQNYKKAFNNFNPIVVASYGKIEKQKLLKNEGIIRNKLKIESTIKNAKIFLEIQKEYGSFNTYIWKFVENRQIINEFKTLSDIPTNTIISNKISKDLKNRGMSFIGSTTIYAFMQAIGIVNDHIIDCFRYNEVKSFI